jgi:hypothetical protein
LVGLSEPYSTQSPVSRTTPVALNACQAHGRPGPDVEELPDAGLRDQVPDGAAEEVAVPDGGAFDGPLGVVAALAAIDLLRQRGVTPRRPRAGHPASVCE